MTVCNEVAEGLYQIGARHWPSSLPEADVAVVFYPTAQTRALDIPTIQLEFGDHDHIPLDEAVWRALLGLSRSLSQLRILSICAEGKNRSGLFSALVLIARGMGPEDAISRVQQRCSSPGTVTALSNRVFQERIRSLSI